MVQTFAVFVDGPTTAKIRTTKVLMLVRTLPLYGVLGAHESKNVKVFSGVSGGVFAEFPAI